MLQTERLGKNASRVPASQTELHPASADGRPGGDETRAPSAPSQPQARVWTKWLLWVGLLCLAILLIMFWRWQVQRPQAVALVHPTVATITETIASSGRVHGVTETIVGTQTPGVVEAIFVAEGDRVTAGQILAILRRDVAEARVAQAMQAINTARAQLAQVEREPLPSEVEAASEQVRQARAQLIQQRATVQQTQESVAQARAQLQQLQAELELATTQLQRYAALLERNYIARADYEQAQTQFRVAENRVMAAQQAVEVAQANVQVAQAGVQAAQANVRALAARLRTVQTGATPEEIEVARQRLEEAERAWHVARQQAQEAIVSAPFAGLITAITAEPGQAVGIQGVVRLISTALEIRLDVDESNLAELALGQDAMISSNAFPQGSFHGRVSEIGAAVDPGRGTVTVTVTPLEPPDWLRPGQTVNVNIITEKDMPRVLVPKAAISRSGDHIVVFTVENGQARERVVMTRPPTAQGVPVLAGLSAEDRIIANAQGITAGKRVRASGRSDGDVP